MLTIASPCILPVLPFVFARAGQSFAKSTLPMLAGMAVTFAAVASLGASVGRGCGLAIASLAPCAAFTALGASLGSRPAFVATRA